MDKLKAVFMGTPDFAVPCLKALQEKAEVIAVITQPDRPKGRGHKLQPSPVKVAALEAGIPVYQPEKIKTPEFTAVLEEMHPDIIIVVAFGQILSQRILDIPRLGCVNVHASLLPRYRGAAPIHWSIINGETETGVTTMLMDAGLDTGDMLLKGSVEITPEMTTEELHDKLSAIGAELLKKTVEGLANGTITPEKQDGAHSNYAKLLKKETGHIDWSKPANEVHNLIRGLNSWPGAWSMKDGKQYKIWRSQVVQGIAPAGEAAAAVGMNGNGSGSGADGTVLAVSKKGFTVACGNNTQLEILEIQPPSKKKMAAGDYVRGHGVAVGELFE